MESTCLSVLGTAAAEPEIHGRFRRRLARGFLTREENPASHFCVYFAAHDPDRGLVFVGRHRKSGLWLFSGGHIDMGESPHQAVRREIAEEWGVAVADEQIGPPQLLTITHTRRSSVIRCRLHYDIWYFVRVDSRVFTPSQQALTGEFWETRWLLAERATELVTDPNTLQAIRLLSDSWASSP